MIMSIIMLKLISVSKPGFPSFEFIGRLFNYVNYSGGVISGEPEEYPPPDIIMIGGIADYSSLHYLRTNRLVDIHFCLETVGLAPPN